MKLVIDRFTTTVNTKHDDGTTFLDTIIGFSLFHNHLITFVR